MLQRCSLVFGTMAMLTTLTSPALADSKNSSLAEFVAAPDNSYRYDVVAGWTNDEVSFTSLRLTSQTFHDYTWHHILTVAKPRHLISTKEAILLVGGGRHDQLPPATSPTGQSSPAQQKTLRDLARQSGLLVALIEQVPDQPLFGDRIEDDAIAYTLGHFFQTGDNSWPLLLPMVKSVVRAMDTVQAFSQKTWGTAPTGFTLSGESKRAWTSWLTAAVDSRVHGLVPLVFDMLNIPAQLAHQLKTWGAYSEEIGDYADKGLPQMLATPRGEQLLQLIDPISYKGQLNVPKIVVLGTNDHYWPLDAAQLYFPALPGQKYLLYLANSGHDSGPNPAIAAARTAVALAAAGVLALPEVNTTFAIDSQSGTGSLRFTSTIAANSIVLMQARSASRDFRQATWQGVTTFQNPPHELTATVKASKAYTAAFLRADYKVQGHDFTVTSEVGMVPPR